PGIAPEDRLIGGEGEFLKRVGVPRTPYPQGSLCHHVMEALLAGATEKQIKTALADWASGALHNGRKPIGTVPSDNEWIEAMARARAVRPAAPVQSARQRPSNARSSPNSEEALARVRKRVIQA